MIVKGALKLNTQYQFEADEKDEFEALNKIITLCNPPTHCTKCGNADPAQFHLTSNKDKEGNMYVSIKCKCGAKANLGKLKAGGFFWHREFEVYVKKV